MATASRLGVFLLVRIPKEQRGVNDVTPSKRGSVKFGSKHVTKASGGESRSLLHCWYELLKGLFSENTVKAYAAESIPICDIINKPGLPNGVRREPPGNWEGENLFA